MKILYGTEVEDKNGNKIGKVNHVIRDTWTGDVRKFGVWRDSDTKDEMVSPENIQEITEDKIVLAVTLDENK